MIRGWIRDESTRATVPQVHDPRQKLARLCVEGSEQQGIRTGRLGIVDQDSQSQTIAGNCHRRKWREPICHSAAPNGSTPEDHALGSADHREFA